MTTTNATQINFASGTPLLGASLPEISVFDPHNSRAAFEYITGFFPMALGTRLTSTNNGAYSHVNAQFSRSSNIASFLLEPEKHYYQHIFLMAVDQFDKKRNALDMANQWLDQIQRQQAASAAILAGTAEGISGLGGTTHHGAGAATGGTLTPRAAAGGATTPTASASISNSPNAAAAAGSSSTPTVLPGAGAATTTPAGTGSPPPPSATPTAGGGTLRNYAIILVHPLLLVDTASNTFYQKQHQLNVAAAAAFATTTTPNNGARGVSPAGAANAGATPDVHPAMSRGTSPSGTTTAASSSNTNKNLRSSYFGGGGSTSTDDKDKTRESKRDDFFSFFKSSKDRNSVAAGAANPNAERDSHFFSFGGGDGHSSAATSAGGGITSTLGNLLSSKTPIEAAEGRTQEFEAYFKSQNAFQGRVFRFHLTHTKANVMDLLIEAYSGYQQQLTAQLRIAQTAFANRCASHLLRQNQQLNSAAAAASAAAPVAQLATPRAFTTPTTAAPATPRQGGGSSTAAAASSSASATPNSTTATAASQSLDGSLFDLLNVLRKLAENNLRFGLLEEAMARIGAMFGQYYNKLEQMAFVTHASELESILFYRRSILDVRSLPPISVPNVTGKAQLRNSNRQPLTNPATATEQQQNLSAAALAILNTQQAIQQQQLQQQQQNAISSSYFINEHSMIETLLNIVGAEMYLCLLLTNKQGALQRFTALCAVCETKLEEALRDEEHLKNGTATFASKGGLRYRTLTAAAPATVTTVVMNQFGNVKRKVTPLPPLAGGGGGGAVGQSSSSSSSAQSSLGMSPALAQLFMYRLCKDTLDMAHREALVLGTSLNTNHHFGASTTAALALMGGGGNGGNATPSHSSPHHSASLNTNVNKNNNSAATAALRASMLPPLSGGGGGGTNAMLPPRQNHIQQQSSVGGGPDLATSSLSPNARRPTIAPLAPSTPLTGGTNTTGLNANITSPPHRSAINAINGSMSPLATTNAADPLRHATITGGGTATSTNHNNAVDNNNNINNKLQQSESIRCAGTTSSVSLPNANSTIVGITGGGATATDDDDDTMIDLEGDTVNGGDDDDSVVDVDDDGSSVYSETPADPILAGLKTALGGGGENADTLSQLGERVSSHNASCEHNDDQPQHPFSPTFVARQQHSQTFQHRRNPSNIPGAAAYNNPSSTLLTQPYLGSGNSTNNAARATAVGTSAMSPGSLVFGDGYSANGVRIVDEFSITIGDLCARTREYFVLLGQVAFGYRLRGQLLIRDPLMTGALLFGSSSSNNVNAAAVMSSAANFPTTTNPAHNEIYRLKNMTTEKHFLRNYLDFSMIAAKAYYAAGRIRCQNFMLCDAAQVLRFENPLRAVDIMSREVLPHFECSDWPYLSHFCRNLFVECVTSILFGQAISDALTAQLSLPHLLSPQQHQNPTATNGGSVAACDVPITIASPLPSDAPAVHAAAVSTQPTNAAAVVMLPGINCSPNSTSFNTNTDGGGSAPSSGNNIDEFSTPFAAATATSQHHSNQSAAAPFGGIAHRKTHTAPWFDGVAPSNADDAKTVASVTTNATTAVHTILGGATINTAFGAGSSSAGGGVGGFYGPHNANSNGIFFAPEDSIERAIGCLLQIMTAAPTTLNPKRRAEVMAEAPAVFRKLSLFTRKAEGVSVVELSDMFFGMNLSFCRRRPTASAAVASGSDVCGGGSSVLLGGGGGNASLRGSVVGGGVLSTNDLVGLNSVNSFGGFGAPSARDLLLFGSGAGGASAQSSALFSSSNAYEVIHPPKILKTRIDDTFELCLHFLSPVDLTQFVTLEKSESIALDEAVMGSTHEGYMSRSERHAAAAAAASAAASAGPNTSATNTNNGSFASATGTAAKVRSGSHNTNTAASSNTATADNSPLLGATGPTPPLPTATAQTTIPNPNPNNNNTINNTFLLRNVNRKMHMHVEVTFVSRKNWADASEVVNHVLSISKVAEMGFTPFMNGSAATASAVPPTVAVAAASGNSAVNVPPSAARSTSGAATASVPSTTTPSPTPQAPLDYGGSTSPPPPTVTNNSGLLDHSSHSTVVFDSMTNGGGAAVGPTHHPIALDDPFASASGINPSTTTTTTTGNNPLNNGSIALTNNSLLLRSMTQDMLGYLQSNSTIGPIVGAFSSDNLNNPASPLMRPTSPLAAPNGMNGGASGRGFTNATNTMQFGSNSGTTTTTDVKSCAAGIFSLRLPLRGCHAGDYRLQSVAICLDKKLLLKKEYGVDGEDDMLMNGGGVTTAAEDGTGSEFNGTAVFNDNNKNGEQSATTTPQRNAFNESLNRRRANGMGKKKSSRLSSSRASAYNPWGNNSSGRNNGNRDTDALFSENALRARESDILFNVPEPDIGADLKVSIPKKGCCHAFSSIDGAVYADVTVNVRNPLSRLQNIIADREEALVEEGGGGGGSSGPPTFASTDPNAASFAQHHDPMAASSFSPSASPLMAPPPPLSPFQHLQHAAAASQNTMAAFLEGVRNVAKDLYGSSSDDEDDHAEYSDAEVDDDAGKKRQNGKNTSNITSSLLMKKSNKNKKKVGSESRGPSATRDYLNREKEKTPVRCGYATNDAQYAQDRASLTLFFSRLAIADQKDPSFIGRIVVGSTSFDAFNSNANNNNNPNAANISGNPSPTNPNASVVGRGLANSRSTSFARFRVGGGGGGNTINNNTNNNAMLFASAPPMLSSTNQSRRPSNTATPSSMDAGGAALLMNATASSALSISRKPSQRLMLLNHIGNMNNNGSPLNMNNANASPVGPMVVPHLPLGGGYSNGAAAGAFGSLPLQLQSARGPSSYHNGGGGGYTSPNTARSHHHNNNNNMPPPAVFATNTGSLLARANIQWTMPNSPLTGGGAGVVSESGADSGAGNKNGAVSFAGAVASQLPPSQPQQLTNSSAFGEFIAEESTSSVGGGGAHNKHRAVSTATKSPSPRRGGDCADEEDGDDEAAAAAAAEEEEKELSALYAPLPKTIITCPDGSTTTLRPCAKAIIDIPRPTLIVGGKVIADELLIVKPMRLPTGAYCYAIHMDLKKLGKMSRSNPSAIFAADGGAAASPVKAGGSSSPTNGGGSSVPLDHRLLAMMTRQVDVSVRIPVPPEYLSTMPLFTENGCGTGIIGVGHDGTLTAINPSAIFSNNNAMMNGGGANINASISYAGSNFGQSVFFDATQAAMFASLNYNNNQAAAGTSASNAYSSPRMMTNGQIPNNSFSRDPSHVAGGGGGAFPPLNTARGLHRAHGSHANLTILTHNPSSTTASQINRRIGGVGGATNPLADTFASAGSPLPSHRGLHHQHHAGGGGGGVYNNNGSVFGVSSTGFGGGGGHHSHSHHMMALPPQLMLNSNGVPLHLAHLYSRILRAVDAKLPISFAVGRERDMCFRQSHAVAPFSPAIRTDFKFFWHQGTCLVSVTITNLLEKSVMAIHDVDFVMLDACEMFKVCRKSFGRGSTMAIGPSSSKTKKNNKRRNSGNNDNKRSSNKIGGLDVDGLNADDINSEQQQSVTAPPPPPLTQNPTTNSVNGALSKSDFRALLSERPLLPSAKLSFLFELRPAADFIPTRQFEAHSAKAVVKYSTWTSAVRRVEEIAEDEEKEGANGSGGGDDDDGCNAADDYSVLTSDEEDVVVPNATNRNDDGSGGFNSIAGSPFSGMMPTNNLNNNGASSPNGFDGYNRQQQSVNNNNPFSSDRRTNPNRVRPTFDGVAGASSSKSDGGHPSDDDDGAADLQQIQRAFMSSVGNGKSANQNQNQNQSKTTATISNSNINAFSAAAIRSTSSNNNNNAANNNNRNNKSQQRAFDPKSLRSIVNTYESQTSHFVSKHLSLFNVMIHVQQDEYRAEQRLLNSKNTVKTVLAMNNKTAVTTASGTTASGGSAVAADGSPSLGPAAAAAGGQMFGGSTPPPLSFGGTAMDPLNLSAQAAVGGGSAVVIPSTPPPAPAAAGAGASAVAETSAWTFEVGTVIKFVAIIKPDPNNYPSLFASPLSTPQPSPLTNEAARASTSSNPFGSTSAITATGGGGAATASASSALSLNQRLRPFVVQISVDESEWFLVGRSTMTVMMGHNEGATVHFAAVANKTGLIATPSIVVFRPATLAEQQRNAAAANGGGGNNLLSPMSPFSNNNGGGNQQQHQHHDGAVDGNSNGGGAPLIVVATDVVPCRQQLIIY